jgi:dipeptidyl aminopeptidase/acylaminoacyl peptidase
MSSSRYLACFLALLPALAPLQAQQRPMTLVDIINMPLVADPHISPDGKQVVFVESQANWKLDRRIEHIFRVNADGSGLTQMTAGMNGENSPLWSPDGKWIAFVAKRGTELDAVNQLFVLPANGGEGIALTTHATAVTNPTWSPDGASIYFRAPDPKPEEQKRREKLKDDVIHFDEDYQQLHLWSVDVATKKEHRLSRGDYSVMSYEISEDGKKVALMRAPSPLLEDTDRSEVWVSDVSGANAHQITKNTVPESGPMLSPDGSQVLFLSQANQSFDTYYNRKIFIAPTNGGAARVLMPDLPYEVERAQWSKDGKSIHFLANMGVHAELFKVNVESPKPEQMTSGTHAIAGWSMSNTGAQAYTSTESMAPGEVWVSSPGSEPHKVTSVCDYVHTEFKLPRQEKISWKGADGVTVEGLLYYPLDYEKGKRYPLAVQTHGGPQASDKYGLGGSQNYVAVLTAKGYAVLQPNYRGSTGYGDDFLRDMVGHYFKNAHLDVLAGVDYLVNAGIADPDRMVKMGWSGGGHMTNKIITVTDRFKAAAAGAGAANWISMYAESDVRTYRTPWFGGTPWGKDAPIAAYWDNSPLKDVWKVKTPTIFMVGQNDVRVPMPQSVEMYRALKSNGVPTHLYVAPREPHGWAELRHVLFKMNVELDWFEKYATKRKYEWETAPGDASKTGDGAS